MKKALSAFCSVILILSIWITASASDDSWQQAYLDVLQETVIVYEPQVEDISVENSYFVYDIDKDGIPELVVKTGTCEADYMAAVFSCRNGQAVRIGEVDAGHSSFYGDPIHGGLIIHQGHSGFASGWRYLLENGQIASEHLFDDNLYERLPDDPDAEYMPVTDAIPEAVPLTLIESCNPLGITHYEEIYACLTGSFPAANELSFPEDNPAFFTGVISNDVTVVASGTDRFSNTPGAVSFHSLLEKDVAVPWMEDDLIITGTMYLDLNRDGKLECILSLNEKNGGSPIRIFLSEENGTVYAYIQNYCYDNLIADNNGTFLLLSEFYQQRYHLVFEKEHCFLLML